MRSRAGTAPAVARTARGPASFTFSCTRCGESVPASPEVWRCSCGGPLVPDLPPFDASRLDQDDRSVWRYRVLLPIAPRTPEVSLGEGGTPLVGAPFDGLDISWKLEYLQPTGSYKDRGATVVATALSAAGVRAAVEDSSGNAGASLAAYLGRAGIGLRLFVPRGTPRRKLRQSAAYGAEVDDSAPDRTAATVAAQAAAGRGVVYAGHVYSPYFLAGLTTLAYEVWEDMGREAPDHVVVPVGHGLLLLGVYRGFRNLVESGACRKMPRFHGVQVRACAPVAEAFERGASVPDPVACATTVARGIRISDPPRGAEVLAAVRGTGGRLTSVGEADVRRAQAELARLGWSVEPTAAVAPAGLNALAAEIGRGETVVVPLTGTGAR